MASNNTAENERRRKLKLFKANKRKFVSAKEYESNGKILVFNSNRCNPDARGKFG